MQNRTLSYLPLPKAYIEAEQSITKRKQQQQNILNNIPYPQLRIKYFPYIGTFTTRYPALKGFPIEIPTDCISIFIEYRFKTPHKIAVDVIQVRVFDLIETLNKNEKTLIVTTEFDTEFQLYVDKKHCLLITKITCHPNSSVDNLSYVSELDSHAIQEMEEEVDQ